MYVSHQPVPALHVSTNFLLIRLTLVLPCLSPAGLSQLYMHQHIFYSSGRPQFCHICYLSACPSFTCINTFSNHPADLILPCLSPVGLSQLSMHQQIFYSSGQPQFCHICYLSACPSFTCINKFSTHPADPSFAIYCQDRFSSTILLGGPGLQGTNEEVSPDTSRC